MHLRTLRHRTRAPERIRERLVSNPAGSILMRQRRPHWGAFLDEATRVLILIVAEHPISNGMPSSMSLSLFCSLVRRIEHERQHGFIEQRQSHFRHRFGFHSPIASKWRATIWIRGYPSRLIRCGKIPGMAIPNKQQPYRRHAESIWKANDLLKRVVCPRCRQGRWHPDAMMNALNGRMVCPQCYELTSGEPSLVHASLSDAVVGVATQFKQ